MQILATVMVGFGSVALYAGLQHLAFYMRNRSKREFITFAALCFTVAAFEFGSAGQYAFSPDKASLFWANWQLAALSAFGLSFIWFIGDLTKSKPGLWEWGLTTWLIILVAGTLVLPAGSMWTATVSDKRFDILGLDLRYCDMQPGAWMRVWIAWGIIVAGYALCRVLELSRTRNRKSTRPLVLAVIIVTLAVINDMAVAVGLYHCVYLMEWAFIALVAGTAESLAVSHFETESALSISDSQMRRLAAAVESAAEAIVVTDTAGRIGYVNPAFEEMTGYKSAECIGKTHSILKSGRHDDQFYKELRTAIAAGKTWKGCFVNRRKDGSLFDDEGTISPVIDESGKIVSYVSVKRDVTHEKMLERQVLRSQKMAAIGQFAHRVAHDFNNTLAVILSNAQRVERIVKDTPETTQCLAQITKSCCDMAEFNAELMAFARAPTLNLRRLRPHAVIRGVEHILKGTLSDGVEMKVETDPDIGEVMIDSDQIEQALVHLALNANDAMPDRGTLTISIRSANSSDLGLLSSLSGISLDDPRIRRFAVFAVSDTGVGIPEKDLPRVFDPFFSTKSDEQKRAGLGLAMVYRIAEWHKGYVCVESRVGSGSVFRIFIPLADPA